MMSFDYFDNSNGAIRRSATTNLEVTLTDWSMKDTEFGDCSTHHKRATHSQRRAGLRCMRPKAPTRPACTSYNAAPGLRRGTHEATRVHHAGWRRGGLAAGGARAAS